MSNITLSETPSWISLRIRLRMRTQSVRLGTRAIQGGPEITERSIQSLCFIRALLWIMRENNSYFFTLLDRHLFPIIFTLITSRSSNWNWLKTQSFTFYETFILIMDCHFRDLPDFQKVSRHDDKLMAKSQLWEMTVDKKLAHKIKSFQPNLMILVLL